MPREQSPDQQPLKKGLNPDNLITDEDESEDLEAGEDAELEDADAPIENDPRLAQDESEQRPADNIDQVDDDADEDDDEDDDEVTTISQ